MVAKELASPSSSLQKKEEGSTNYHPTSSKARRQHKK
jgi:hypothetical protein